MTTILGIKTNSGPDAVVLVADMQINYYQDEKLFEKNDGEKIKKGKNWAMAYMGDIDAKIESFYKLIYGDTRYTISSFLRFLKTTTQFDMLDPRRITPERVRTRAKEIKRGKIDEKELGRLEIIFSLYMKNEYEPKGELEQEILEYMKAIADPVINPVEAALKRKFFYEVEVLNSNARSSDADGSNEFLLATNIQHNDKKVELYKVDCYGKLISVEPVESGLEFLCGGSGSENVKTFFEKEISSLNFHEQPIDTEQITIKEAIFLADRAMKKASADIHTGVTYSLVVVTESGIDTIDITSKDKQSHETNLEEEMKKYQQE